MGKVKVVETENDVPALEAPAPEAAAPEEPNSQPELSQAEETQIEAPKPTLEEKQPEPKKKQLEYVTCEECNKCWRRLLNIVIKNCVNHQHQNHHHLLHLSPKLQE